MPNLLALFFACVVFLLSFGLYWGLFQLIDIYFLPDLSATGRQIVGALILLLAIGTGISAYRSMTTRDDD